MAKQVKLFIVLAILLGVVSCRTPQNIAYFQDLKADASITVNAQNADIKLREGDKLSIMVSCRDENVAKMFNLMSVTQTIGNSYSQRVSHYTVDNKGTIDFPVIGKIEVKGLNRTEVLDLIKQKLVSSEMITDPVVVVEFQNMYFDVLGEMARPGRYTIEKDRMTILEALSMAGDLSIVGQRCNVKVLRDDENGNKKVYEFDMTKGEDLLTSPIYYIQQNDVLYVESNNFRKRQSKAAGNTVYNPSFWISVASFLSSMYVIFIKD